MGQTSKKSIVIIGGGHAGISLSRRLSTVLDPTKHSLLLINPRPFSIWLPAMIRIVTAYHEDLEGRAYLPYTHLFPGRGTFLEGEVSEIRRHNKERGGMVVLRSGQEVPFDVLVLATESVWQGPFSFGNSKEAMEKEIGQWRHAVKEAKKIILVGGGAIALEYAGEIKDSYPDADITIIHAASKLLNNTYPSNFREMVEKDLRIRGVNFVLGDVVEASTNKSVTCRSGKELTADLVVPCHGSRPNTSLLRSFDPRALTSVGHIRVNSHLQIPDHADIFAIGDIIDYPEQKQAGKVHDQAAVVSQNIMCFLNGQTKESGSWKEYKGSYEILVLTNGKNDGSSYFGLFGLLSGLSFGSWITTSFLRKSRNLLIPFARKMVGLTN